MTPALVKLPAALILAFLPPAVGAPAPDPGVEPPAHQHYTLGPASADGTGKFYMGREIAKVMGHEGIDWLERGHREDEESPGQAVEALALQPHDTVADVGAGSGFYAFRLAALVPQGRVLAVDIQPEMLEFIERRARESGTTNVTAHRGRIDSVALPPESLDVALMVDAYHEFSHPREMLESLRTALRPGGRVVLVEYRAEDPEVPIKPLHKMSQKQIRRELEDAGFIWQATREFLPWQHFMIFTKADPRDP